MTITSGSRFTGIIRWSDDNDAMTRSQFDQSHEAVDDVAVKYGQGVAGLRPTAGATWEGSFYYDTGNDVLAYCDGTEWINVSLEGKPTSSNIVLADGYNIQVGTSSGAKIGTSTSQKIGFYNATPVAQQSNTVSTRSALSTLGLIATGGDTVRDFKTGSTRPTSPSAGQPFYNTTQARLEYYTGAAWVGVVPCGVIAPFYGTTAPSGWLFCDGSAISGTYTELIALVGANTPDLRSKSLVGRATTGSSYATTGDDALNSDVEIVLVPDVTTYTPQVGDVYGNLIANSGGTVTNLTNVPPSGTVNWIIKT